MRKIIKFIVTVSTLLPGYSFAQTNTFPVSGNVGVGTSSPTSELHVSSVRTSGLPPHFLIVGGKDVGSAASVGLQRLNVNQQQFLAFETGNSGNPDGYLGVFGNKQHALYLLAATGDGSNTAIGVDGQSGFVVGLAGNIINSYNARITPQGAAYFAGNVGIGTNTPENAEVWDRVLEVRGNAHSKILATTNNVYAGLWAHDAGHYNAPAGGIAGTKSNHPYSLITNGENRLTINAAGNIGIGTSNPQSKLAVNGDVFARKITITQTGWPDYVFSKQYLLPSLAEVEAYIKKHQHLKDIVSAEEVEKNGLDLGEYGAALLKKVEELTLYMIEMKKLLGSQQEKINELQKQVKRK